MVSKPINAKKDLVEICKELLSKEYKIFDNDVENVWETLVPHINKLTWLIQDYFPDYMSNEFKKTRSYSNKIGNRKEILTEISKIKKWRNHLGELIKDILMMTKEFLLKSKINLNDFSKSISKIIDDYEIDCFGGVLKTNV